MVEVGTQRQPCTEQDWESCNHCESEEARDDHWRRLGVGAEDVVDLWQLSVAEGCCRDSEWRGGVPIDLKGEDPGVERLGRAERCDGDLCRQWSRGGNELVRKILVRLLIVRCLSMFDKTL